MDERDDQAMPTDDPRGTSTGGGYPEESPEEVTGGGDKDDGPERDVDNPDAPSVSSPEESDPGQATGNPGAAG
jgi:hypothetical protein